MFSNLPKNILISTQKNDFFDWFLAQNYTKIIILVDENTEKYCYQTIQKLLPLHLLICIKSGEIYKNLRTCEQILKKITKENFDRKAVFINVGGGVIGDLGGFCASIYKRGIDFIQIPTTLLAQVDASVGGKTGIDFQGFKNQIGVFALPKMTWINTDFLQTLPSEQIVSGFAEVIKHSLIADKNEWNFLSQNISKTNINAQNWQKIITHSIQIKAKIVTEDPTEKGIRKILNFGHTLGHALESFLLNKPKRRILHGEAVAQGMIWASFLSQKIGFPATQYQEIKSFLTEIYPNIIIKKNEVEKIIQLTYQDKKNINNTLNFVLLPEIGEAKFDVKLNENDLKTCFL
ncbi:MAG: 3-dehydroquinate synthase [Bacteroidetes bacterium]|nr:MAG: 3-dehydroquinate synthase [Bacteroidota bacterium]